MFFGGVCYSFLDIKNIHNEYTIYFFNLFKKKPISNIFTNSTTIAQSMQKFSHLLLEGFEKEIQK